MGNTSPNNITYPDLPDPVGALNADLAILAQSVQTALTAERAVTNGKVLDFYNLPPVTSVVSSPDLQNITAGTWSSIPSLASVTLSFARPAWVQCVMSAWAVATVGDVRAAIDISGATVWAPNYPNWGSVLYAANNPYTNQLFSMKTVLVNAGSTTFTPKAYQSGGGVKQINYASMQIIPIRWDEEPA